MASLLDMANKLKSINLNDILDSILDPLLPEIVEMNKAQLWDGKTKNNTDIHPFYSEDPFFKTEKQAQAYKNWKQRITPNPDRNPDAPNLYINGYYHSLIKGAIMDTFIDLDAEGFGSGFDNKYKDIYGLTEDHLNIIRNKILPQLLEQTRFKMGIT
jgi:hypothetical protein